jgi:hypothetical protein
MDSEDEDPFAEEPITYVRSPRSLRKSSSRVDEDAASSRKSSSRVDGGNKTPVSPRKSKQQLGTPVSPRKKNATDELKREVRIRPMSDNSGKKKRLMCFGRGFLFFFLKKNNKQKKRSAL